MASGVATPGKGVWLPIATAPQNGQEILCWRPDWVRPMLLAYVINSKGAGDWVDIVNGNVQADSPAFWLDIRPLPA